MLRVPGATLIAISVLGIGWSSCQVPPSIRSNTVMGVVVEQVGEGSALAKAGIKAGDILLSWRRLPSLPANPEGASGALKSVFDWKLLEIEQAPRGLVELAGQRSQDQGVRVLTFKVNPGSWRARVRPEVPKELLREYWRGQGAIENNNLAHMAIRWRDVAVKAKDSHLRCWIHFHLGDIWADNKHWTEAVNAYQSALQETPDPASKSFIWRRIGEVLQAQSQPNSALDAYNSAKAIREGTRPGMPLALAESLNDLGSVAYDRGQYFDAMDFFQRALILQRTHAPDSLPMATTLNNLGAAAWSRGDLIHAEQLMNQSLAIREELAPNGLEVASCLNALGAVARHRGDLHQAMELYQRALSIREAHEPDGLSVAVTLHNMAVVARTTGDLTRSKYRLLSRICG